MFPFRRRAIAPDPAKLTLAVGGERVEVAVKRRPAAKRLTLRLSGRSGELTLTLPPTVAIATAEAFLHRQAEWIATRKARLPERILLGVGSVVPLRDVPHRIVHRPGRSPTTAAPGPDGEPVIVVGGPSEAVSGRVRRFLAREAERDLAEAAGRYANQLGVRFSRLTLRDTTSRWGSCSASGALSFSWRLVMAPPFVLDYLAAHEVAHLCEMNHSPNFWRILSDACPATAEAENWLKRSGASLHRYV